MDTQAALEVHLETVNRPVTEQDPLILFAIAAVLAIVVLLL
jgi:hypothetical protein